MTHSVAGFDWDAGNRDKCRKHGVSLATIEALFERPLAVFPDPAHAAAEERVKAIGRTQEGRPVFLVFTIRHHAGARLIRPLSARDMHQKEIAADEQALANPPV